MSADWELQRAIVTALKASSAIKALIGDPPRIEQQASAATVQPYVHIGESDGNSLRATCINAAETTVTLHVWSKNDSFRETKLICAALVDALDEAELSVEGHYLGSLLYRDTRTMRDPNGISRHGVATFRALTQRA